MSEAVGGSGARLRAQALAWSLAVLWLTACRGPGAPTTHREGARSWPRLSYAGRDSAGAPHYIGRRFTPEERRLLSRAFGIGDPNRLYLSDSSATGVLTWDLEPDSGWTDMEYSFNLGFASLRRTGESLARFKERMQATPSAFPPSARVRDTALADLDPSVRPLFVGLVEAARARGFDVRVAETYRSPERQGWLMSRQNGSTFSGTSIHAYGRAVDFVIGNGYGRTVHNRREYVAFRNFVLKYGKGRLRLLGTPSDTWDWGHVEAPAAWLGFHDVEDALAAARRCVGGGGAHGDGPGAHGGAGAGGMPGAGGAGKDPPPCVFQPRLGARDGAAAGDPSARRPAP